MPDSEHMAPPGKFIVGETIFSEDEWNPVSTPLNTLKEALHFRDELISCRVPDLGYSVHDENGLVESESAQ